MFTKVWNSKVWTHIGVFLISMTFAAGVFAQDGEALFRSNCASCHKLDGRLVGPALSGVQDRWDDQERLISWIRNSLQYLDEHPDDDYAHSLYEEFNKSPMPPVALSDEEILAILDYIENPDAGKEEQTATGPEVTGGDQEAGDDYTFYWLIGFLLVLLVVVKVLMDVKSSVKRLLYEVKGEEEFEKAGEHFEPEDLTMSQRLSGWASANKTLVALGGVVVLVVVLNVVWNGLLGVGVYDGYAPEQPIKFSHKIHAGDNEISCVYCHHSAEKGKHSNIPSAKLCMNCHTGIQEGSRWGTEEISKIYDAVGYNPETAQYDKPEQPIKWIRIHNLPDLAYFNHSQHVVAGKIECQECHGPVEEFDYPMKQHAELTMGWCVDCHRNTDVKMKGNGYYDKLHAQLLEKYKEEGLEKFTVDQIGGLECAKCHY